MTTSNDSYNSAIKTGLISKRQYQVLSFIKDNENNPKFGGSISQGDCGRYYLDSSSSFQPRFKELEDNGIIKCIGTKIDTTTLRRVKSYRTTGKSITHKIVARPQKILLSKKLEEYRKTEQYKELARKVKLNAENRCQICNKSSENITLDCHHRAYKRINTVEEIKDCVALCRNCHFLYHKSTEKGD